jgi:Uma2 family endonuclease
MMPVLVLDREVASMLLSDREASPGRCRDEVWDGVTFIMPEPDLEHVDIATFFVWVFRSVFDPEKGDRVQGQTNVSDRATRWKTNYRVPDMSLFLAGNLAQDRKTHWYGGPDLALEIVSPDDRSRDKLDFYARTGTREVLVLDRNPWQLELYRVRRGRMRLVGAVTPGDGASLTSLVVPFRFELFRGRPRPKVKIVHTQTGQEWVG